MIGAVCAALGAAVSGGVVALAQSPHGTVFYACESEGALVQPLTVRVNRTPSCGAGQSVVSWNQAGPQGAPGRSASGAIVTSITGHPSQPDAPGYYAAVLRLTSGTWQVEGTSDATDCVPLSTDLGATIQHQYFPSLSSLSPQALVRVARDGQAEVTFSCHGAELAHDFSSQLLALPVSVQPSGAP